MKRLLTVTFFTALLTVIRMAASFIVAKVVAIHTGPAGVAMLGQLQNIVTGMGGVINAPVASSVVRFTAENHTKGFEECAPWWRVSLKWSIALFVLIFPFVILFSKEISSLVFANEKFSWLIIISVLILPFTAFGTLVNSVINGQQQYKRYVSLGFLSVVVSSTVMLLLVIYKGLHGALLAAAIQNGLIGIALLILSLKQPWFKLKYWWGRTEKAKVRIVGGYVLMSIVSALALSLSMIFVRTTLVNNVGWEVTGYWQAVWKISETYLGVVTMSLSIYYFPQLAKLDDYSELKKEINATAKVVMPIVVLMAIAVFLLRDTAISLLFTEKFKAARDLFFIQLVGDVLKILAWLYAYPMISRGAVKWFVSSEIIFACCFSILAYVFIHKYGVHGANIAYCTNYLLYLLFVTLNLKHFGKKVM